MAAPKQLLIDGSVSERVRARAGGVRRELHASGRARGRVLHLPGRREGRRPVGRRAGSGERRAVARRTRWSSSTRRPRAWRRWSWRSRTRAAGSTTTSVSAAYWPEFAQNGKERITVRQLLAHQAGLFAFDEPVDREVVADLDRLAEIMARQRPAWEPGERQAYHAISLGFYEGELIRRIDPAHRSLGQVLRRRDRRRRSASTSTSACRSRFPNERLAPLEPPEPLEAADRVAARGSCWPR